jgi:hypothetical protein
MPRFFSILVILALIGISVLFAGCTTQTPAAMETGSLQVNSLPSGAEIYLDNEYRGTTPASIDALTLGTHIVEVRMAGYERWTSRITLTNSSSSSVLAHLVQVPVTPSVTFATTTSPVAKPGIPQIHVDGYWVYPQGRDSTTNPVFLLVHTEAFNVGSADAREVTVVANFFYETRLVCWNTIYLGTLPAGGHSTKDTMISCSLPQPISNKDLAVQFDDLVVNP